MEENEETKVETIRVVEKMPNEDAKIVSIPNDYRTIADYCKGLIDIVTLPKDESCTLICNDNGIPEGMEPNIVLPEREEVIVGPIIICGYDEDTGNSISLTDKQAETALKYCARNNLHHMSLEGAYRYAKVIGPLQESEDELNKQVQAMEAE